MDVYNDPRRLKTGFYDLGRVVIPVAPAVVGFVDRITRVVYYLSWSGNTPTLVTSMPILNRDGYVIYKAYEEPVLTGSSVRPFVSNGTLSFEAASSTITDPPIYARQNNVLDRRQLVFQSGVLALLPINTDQTK